MSPRVTVLMPVYNGERFLRKAIESVLAQTFSDFELLIVNDGSTDGSHDVISSYRDSRIRSVNNSANEGLTSALNRGLRLATGEYVARQDSDDVSTADRLQRQVSFLDANPSVALLGSAAIVIDAFDRELHTIRPPKPDIETHWRLLFYNCLIHSTIMFRRALVSEHNYLYEASSPVEDYELWSRIAMSYRVSQLPEPLVRWRKHEQSISSIHDHDFLEYDRPVASRNLRRLLPQANDDTIQDLWYLGRRLYDRIPPPGAFASLCTFLQLQCAFLEAFPFPETMIGLEGDWRRRMTSCTWWQLALSLAKRGKLPEALQVISDSARRDPGLLLVEARLWSIHWFKQMIRTFTGAIV